MNMKRYESYRFHHKILVVYCCAKDKMRQTSARQYQTRIGYQADVRSLIIVYQILWLLFSFRKKFPVLSWSIFLDTIWYTIMTSSYLPFCKSLIRFLLEMLQVFTPLVEKCKKYGRAMRIGTNHGSLSDRIMSYYGDSPRGMVSSNWITYLEYSVLVIVVEFDNLYHLMCYR